MSNKDVLIWLTQERDRHAAKREAAFAENDLLTANVHADASDNLYKAILEIERSRSRLETFTEVLQSRLIVALREAKRA